MPTKTKPFQKSWGDLPQQLKRAPGFPNDWMKSDFELFLELEAVLHLYEVLVPEAEKRSARDAWSLVSGYIVVGLNDQPEQQRMCLLLRQRLRFLKTASAWRRWLRWYREQPESIRLYAISTRADSRLEFRQQLYSAVLREQRIAAYTKLASAEILDHENSELRWASEGTYTYWAEGQPFTIEINKAMAQFADRPMPSRRLPSRSRRTPIEVDLDVLLETARELDELEIMFEPDARGHWFERLNRLQFASIPADNEPVYGRTITLDGLFHLAGALGVGKSSLIGVLTYHLACKLGLHVTVVLNTIVETIDMSVWLRRLGVAAAPALGRQRADHQRKYGLARADALQADSMMRLDAPEHPVLTWLPAPCAISGAAAEPIAPGQEPCHRLYDDQQGRYTCPLLPVCPVHATKRDLVDSQVWTVNPMSLLYSSAPPGLGERRISLLEAVYHRSDVLIIDEADRVQVQWDRTFAPTSLIAGSDDALLDQLHPLITNAAVGRYGRRLATGATFDRLNTIDSQAHLLVGRAFRLLRASAELQK